MSLSISASQFEVIEKHLDVELLTPVLKDLGLLLPADIEKLAGKLKKPAVKFILKKAKQHSEGFKLFCDSLEQTKTNEGHQKILRALYHVEDLGLQVQGTVATKPILSSHACMYLIISLIS